MRNLMKLGGVLMMVVILMFITVKSYADQSECNRHSAPDFAIFSA